MAFPNDFHETVEKTEVGAYSSSDSNASSTTLRSSRSDKLSLITRLRKLDQANTFPRFMELPPELRLAVYESLLTDTRVRIWSGNDAPAILHPAILCASK